MKYLIFFILSIVGFFMCLINIIKGDREAWGALLLVIIFGGWAFYKLKSQAKHHNDNINQNNIYISYKYATGIQLLECIYNITTTRNLDTLQGSIDFVNKIYESFVNLYNANYTEYRLNALQSIDDYKVRYYDRVLTDTQASHILRPNSDKLDDLYSACIAGCYERYVDFQSEQLNKLVRENAIQKRKQDIIGKGYAAKSLYKKYNIPDNNNIARIDNIIKSFEYTNAV